MGEAVYARAKGAIISFSPSRAKELAGTRINCNLICLKPSNTP